MRQHCRLHFGLFLLLAVALPAHSVELKALETKDLRLIYFDPVESYLAPYAARTFTNSLASQQKHFGFAPDGKVTVLMKDFSDYGNAAAGAVPRNTLLVDIAPVSFAFETFAPSERMYTLMNHELVHVATMDQATRRDKKFRRLFGGKVAPNANHPESILYSYLTAPRVSTPRWYLEGSAVFMETWMAGGLGRAQGAYDEMVFRSMVLDDAHFYDPLGLASEGMRIDFQVGVNAYLYGTRFMSYLALTYSPEKLIEWLTRPEGSKAYYAHQFRHVFGRELGDVWHDWIEFEKSFQHDNLETLRQFPITAYRDLTDRGLGSVSRAYVDEQTGNLYAGLRYPGVASHLAAISLQDGSLSRLQDIKSPLLYQVTSLAFNEETRTLYYTQDNQAFRDLVAYDLASGQQKVLLKDARIGELVLNRADQSLWGIRQANGLATLVRVPPPYTDWEQIRTFPYGELLYDMDISPDGMLLATAYSEVNGDQSLRVFRLDTMANEQPDLVARQDFGSAAPEGFVFSGDSRYLYGSSYYTGVSNIFRLEVANGAFEALSNAETGFFRPLPLADGTLLVMRYSGDGFVPAVIDPKPLEDVNAIRFLGNEIARKYPEVTEWSVPSPATVPIDQLITSDAAYRPFREIRLESMYPVVEGYKDATAIGLHTRFSDPISMNGIEFTASYSPDDSLESDERLHGRLLYERMGFSADLRYNYADFYDLFGPTKTGLKGHSITLGYERPLIYDKPRQLDFSSAVSYYGGLDRVPLFQDITTEFDELASIEASLNYQNINKSLGAVDGEKGWLWQMTAGANRVNGDTIPYVYGRLDAGMALPIRHSSLWIRNAVGKANGRLSDPFASFYFGGFGNNWVDRREIKRYREAFSFPGYEINEIGGQEFARTLLEWNLPPVSFEKVGSPGFFASWLRPAIFASALHARTGQETATYQNVGVQIDVQLYVFSRLEMTLSVGAARGFANGNAGRDEFMLSLKIL